jgi:hypothetical protein
VWYQYHPSTDQLEVLKTDPYQAVSDVSPALTNLNNVQTDSKGSYENVRVSPEGDRFIYPRINQKRSGYWYADTKTGMQIDLGIPAKIGEATVDVSLTSFWSATSQRFVVEGQGWSNSYVPVKIVTLEGQKANIQVLTDLSPFSTYGEGFRASNFRVMGISTDGTYILIQPETMDNISWLYNLDTAQISTVNFSIRGEQVVWLNATTFVALTTTGVLQYDIEKQIAQTVFADETLKSVVESWSPDGRFLIGQYSGIDETTERKFVVCQIR